MQAPGLRAQVEQAEVRGLVDPQRGALDLVADPQDLRPIVLGHVALAQLVRRDPRAFRDQPLGEFGVRHLEREEGDRAAFLDRHVLGDVGDETRLAHARPRGEDDQVAGLKAAGDLVEVGKPGGRSSDVGLAARELLEAVDLPREDVLEHVEVLGLLLVGDLEEQLLRPLGELIRLALAVVDRALDLVRGREQTAQQRVLLDDPRVVLGVAGDRNGRGEVGDRLAATGGLEVARLAEKLRDRERVDRLAALVQRLDRAEDQPVAVAVEVLLSEADVEDDRVHRHLRHHQGAEHRLLGLEVLRWDVGGGGFHRLLV